MKVANSLWNTGMRKCIMRRRWSSEMWPVARSVWGCRVSVSGAWCLVHPLVPRGQQPNANRGHTKGVPDRPAACRHSADAHRSSDPCSCAPPRQPPTAAEST